MSVGIWVVGVVLIFGGFGLGGVGVGRRVVLVCLWIRKFDSIGGGYFYRYWDDIVF